MVEEQNQTSEEKNKTTTNGVNGHVNGHAERTIDGHIAGHTDGQILHLKEHADSQKSGQINEAFDGHNEDGNHADADLNGHSDGHTGRQTDGQSDEYGHKEAAMNRINADLNGQSDVQTDGYLNEYFNGQDETDVDRSSVRNGAIRNTNEYTGTLLKLPDESKHINTYLNGKVNGKMNGNVEMVDEKMKAMSDDKSDDASDDESDETKIIKVEPEAKKMVGTLELFKFADWKDRLMMILGTLCALLQGTAMPIVFLIFGNMTDLFVNNAALSNYINSILPNLTVCNANITYEWAVEHQTELSNCMAANNMTEYLNTITLLYQGSLLDQMRSIALIYVYLGIAVIICGYIEMACWQIAAANQCQRIRSKLLRSILSQDIGWFDTHETGELHSRLVDDIDQIEAGIGDKMALFFQYFCAFIAGFIIGFVRGWQLTLVMLSVTPLLAISAAVVNKLAAIMSRKEQGAYAKAGAVAEEVLGAIRTVTMFGGQEKECVRYNEKLLPSKKFGIRKGWVTGIGIGAVFFLLFSSYALAFWYGSDLVRNNPAYTAGTLTTVFFAIIIGSFSLGNAAPQIQDFANARGAAYEVYRLIDLVSSIDSNSKEGKKPEKPRGDIEFKNVQFSYPSRSEIPILKDMSFKVSVGQTVALVGSSGCGKSTTVQILQRFYDILSGTVLIDGLDIKEWNVDHLRRQIGVVSQEPVLFATSIAENIRYGRQEATMDDVVAAARKANAHQFISQLPDKYETMVGERGAQLSGGQKQRIAIARALVRDPKILLLDEATSALDTQSESTVQQALDQARLGRTTIIIAHRLSTVRTADYILGVADGKVVEQGNHDQLMQLGKLYYNLVTSQTSGDKEKVDPDDFIPTGDYVFSRQLSTISNKSTKSTGEDIIKIIKAKDAAENVDMMRLLKMNSPEWKFILVAIVMATINGCVQPCFAFVFAEILAVFSIEDLVEQKKKTDFLSAMFLVIGIVASLSVSIMHGMFGYTGENLTFRLRKNIFKILLQQDIGYFDDPANTTGAMCSRLSSDASLVRGAAGSRIGYVIQGMAAIGLGLIIGFVYSWQLTLVVLCFAPLTLMSGFVQSKVVRRGGITDKKMETASSIAIEAIENIRTVTSLSLQELSHAKYTSEMTHVYKGKKRSAHVISIAYAVSQSVIFFADAACFTFGAYLIQYTGLQYDDMFKVFLAVIMGAQAAGRSTSFAPDYGKAKSAAARIFTLFDRVPPIDISSNTGQIMANISGLMDFSQIEFVYPSRPKVKVLRGINFTVEPGTRVALVGSSGCGKSTTMQLLQRFYDPANGCIKVDGARIDSLNLGWWRSQLGFVSQEPILFDCSIGENIAYGDNSRKVEMNEIIEAAKKANIHNFIKDLPKGYETSAGDKGAQLSGGQKQRIAIARALVRNPKILLLDEATSALDMESEKIVQEALDKAQEGRTSLVIAHRLSTIQNSDKIFVFHNGKIVESGTHASLLANQGLYHKLYTVSAITSNS